MALQLPGSNPKPLAAGIHSTDAFHRRPLFAVHPREGGGKPVLVRSWGEAHALHGPARSEDVNPAYVAALVRDTDAASVAPYRRIQRLPRAHHVLLAPDGTLSSSPYDPLAAGAGPMPAEQLHAFLRQGLLDHLQRALAGHHGPIGCEHSSGHDSNAVLGGLVHGLGLSPDRLHTWSQESGGEGPLLEQFRLFHRLHAAHCHRSGPFDPWRDPDGRLERELRVFGAPGQNGGNALSCGLLARQGCTLLFSGFGGDQAISHNANNVPTDLVAQGRWGDLVAWVGGRRRALRIAAGRGLALAHRPWAESRVLARAREGPHSDLLERTLTDAGQAWLAPHLQEDYPWEIDGYVPQAVSIRRRVLSDWLAVRVDEESRLAAAHGLSLACPLLDERLIGTLLQQDPLLFGEGQQRGRLIHRRAFAPFLPLRLQTHAAKGRVPEEGLETCRQRFMEQRRAVLVHHLMAAGSWHPALRRWWDLEAIRREAEAMLERSEVPSGVLHGTYNAIQTMASLSHWWGALDG
ncbi:MAG: asparagine synthase-related protein [Cyanobacteriota bacterium]|nr:asparagine synthase-related protein [Cyanobacteriota bacterium]